jgi:hypothetical protein
MIPLLLRGQKHIHLFFKREAIFLSIIAALVIASALLFPYPLVAMWLGFGIAGYSAIANDSIQTLGTFLSSNGKMRWWILWLFIGGILVLTYASGWYLNSGDIAFDRLSSIPQPQSFSFLTLSAPIILLILTRLRMPVSTTFLLLSTFSSAVVIQKMLLKTFAGYIIAFTIALLVWSWIAGIRSTSTKKYNRNLWRTLQACSTGFLWWAWLMQDTANVAVFLPRALSMQQMMIAVGYLFCVVGLLMYQRGGGIQSIVTEKTDIVDTRAATGAELPSGTQATIPYGARWRGKPCKWVRFVIFAFHTSYCCSFSSLSVPFGSCFFIFFLSSRFIASYTSCR